MCACLLEATAAVGSRVPPFEPPPPTHPPTHLVPSLTLFPLQARVPTTLQSEHREVDLRLVIAPATRAMVHRRGILGPSCALSRRYTRLIDQHAGRLRTVGEIEQAATGVAPTGTTGIADVPSETCRVLPHAGLALRLSKTQFELLLYALAQLDPPPPPPAAPSAVTATRGDGDHEGVAEGGGAAAVARGPGLSDARGANYGRWILGGLRSAGAVSIRAARATARAGGRVLGRFVRTQGGVAVDDAVARAVSDAAAGAVVASGARRRQAATGAQEIGRAHV